MSKYHPLLFLPLLHTTLAGPRHFSSKTVVLSRFPYDLPDCATKCIEDFISTSFPACSTVNGLQNIGCLCPSESNSGLTLGEGALRCLVTSCQAATVIDFDSAYTVCSGIEGAQPETHSVLSASVARATTIGFNTQTTTTTHTSTRFHTTTKIMTSSSETSSLSHIATLLPTHSSSTRIPLDSTTSSTRSHTSSLADSTAASSSSSSSSFLTSPTSSPTAAAASEASVAAKPILNKAQVAGIAVAGAGIGIIAISLLVFLFCLKKRDSKRRDSDASFGNLPPTREKRKPNSDPEHSPISSRTPQQVGPKAHQMLGLPVGPSQKRWTLWKNAMAKPPSAIGLAISPEGHRAITHESSPMSIESYHTTSNLLPDKPIYSQSALRGPLPHYDSQQQQSAPERSQQQAQQPRKPVQFAAGVGLRVISATPPPARPQQSWQERNTSQPSLQQQRPALRNQTSDPFISQTSDPRARMYALERQSQSRASNKDLPRIITPASQFEQFERPRQHPPPSGQYGSPSLIPAPLNPTPVGTVNHGPRLLPSPSIYSRAASSYSQPQQESHQQQYQQDYSLTSPPPAAQFNKYAPLPSTKRRTSANRPLTHLTTGSESTFFEDDRDDESPPLELPAGGKDLSPVAEVRSQRGDETPLSKVRYPVVPGSSAERPVRSPRRSPIQYSQHTQYKSMPGLPYPQTPPTVSTEGATTFSTPIRGQMSTNTSVSERSHHQKRDLPPARALVELPERSSSRKAPQPQRPGRRDEGTSGGGNGSARIGAKWQILCAPGLDGTVEVSGSPTDGGGRKENAGAGVGRKTKEDYTNFEEENRDYRVPYTQPGKRSYWVD